MRLQISQIQQVTNQVFESIKERNKGDFDIDLTEDFYYQIPSTSLYDIGYPPKELTIGSLTDDVEEIGKITSKERNPVTPDLNKLAAILRYLAEHCA